MEAPPAPGTRPATERRSPSDNRLRLSIVDATFALFCVIPPLVFGVQLLNSDGDAARHIRMGQLLLAEGFGATDPFSFTEPGGHVVLTEWGSRILYALVHEVAGLAGVALFAGVLIGAASALIVLLLVRRGVDPLLAYLIGIVTAFGGQVHWLARPHLVTLVALALLLFLLEPGRTRRVLWFAPLFVVWANLHGGFVLGLVLVGVYLGGSVLQSWLSPEARGEWLALARYYAIGLIIALASSMVTPTGPAGFFHIADLLGHEMMTSTTHEFQSPNFHTIYGRQFLVLLGLVVAALAFVRDRPDLRRLGLVLLLMAAALTSRRNIPLFALLATPIVALHADGAWRSLRSIRLARVRQAFRDGEAAARPGLWTVPVLAIVVLLGAARGSVAGVPLVPDRFDEQIFPVAAVDWAQANGVTGRVFNLFPWGGYMIYAWPEQPIFIDGMTDYFSRDLLTDYITISGVNAGWADRLEHWDIDLVLMPPAAHLVYTLEREPGWTRLYEDSTAVLLGRTADERDDR